MALAQESFLSQPGTRRLQRYGLLLSMAVLLFPPWAHSAKPRSEVFHLGQFDRSSQEFHDELPDQAVRVSANDPEATHKWFAFQPEQSSAANAKHPIAAEARTIAFQIVGAPASGYTLRIALLIEHPSVPVLRVAINGHSGSFFLDPKLVETEDDESVFFPSFSRADLSFDIPGSYLHTGENENQLRGGSGDKRSTASKMTSIASNSIRPLERSKVSTTSRSVEISSTQPVHIASANICMSPPSITLVSQTTTWCTRLRVAVCSPSRRMPTEPLRIS